MGAEVTRAGGSPAPLTRSMPDASASGAYTEADAAARSDAEARAQRDGKAKGNQAQAGRGAVAAQTTTSRAVTQQQSKRGNGEPSRGRVTVAMVQQEIAAEFAKTEPLQSIDTQTFADRTAEVARAVRGRLSGRALDPAARRELDAAERFPTLLRELRKQRDVINPDNPSLPQWLRRQIQDGTFDVDNFALTKAIRFDANKTAGMSETERRVLHNNALVSALLQRHNIRIEEGSNLLPVVTVNGARVALTQEHYDLWRQVKDGDPTAFALTMLPRDGRDGELQLLKQASSLLRLERTKSQVADLMRGSRPDDGAALRLLKTSMANANLPGEAQQLWEQAGAPYFDQAYVDAKLREASSSLKLDWREVLGLYDGRLERVGPWLWQMANEAPAPVVSMALDAVKRDLKENPVAGAGEADLFAGLLKGVEVVAETTGVDRSQELADWWLTRPLPGSPDPLRLLMTANVFDGPWQHVRIGVEKAGGNPGSPLLHALLKTADSVKTADSNPFRTAISDGVNNAAQKAYRENRASLYREFAGRGDEAARRASLEPFFNRFKGPGGKGIEGIALGRGRRFRTETELHNFLGQMMGLMPVNVQAARAQDQRQEWYPDKTSEGLQVRWVAQKISVSGGPNAQVRAIPTLYASKDEGDVRRITLFEVVSADGKTTLIDSSEASQLAMMVGVKDLMLGRRDINSDGLFELLEGPWEYEDFKDFLNDNQLDREGMLYRLESGSGQLAVVGSAAAQWTATRKGIYWLDVGASIAGLAASIVLLPTSGGSSSVSAWAAGARLATLMFMGYGAFSSGRQLWIMGKHGASLSLSNPEARAHWIGGVGGTVTGLGTLGTTLKAAAALKAGNLGKAAPWERATKGLGAADLLIGAEVLAEQTYYLRASAPYMSSRQLKEAFGFYALGAAQIGIGIAGPRLVKDYRNLTASSTGPVTPNPKGLPDDLAMSEVVREMFFGVPRRNGEALPPTNGTYAKFYNHLSPDEQAKLPKPGGKVSADQLTRALAQLPGGLEKVVLDIHAHPMGYIQRLDVTLASSEGKIKAGDSYNADTRDGHYIATPNELHLVANDRSSARWRPDDPDNIEGLTADGSHHRIPIDAVLPPEAGAAAQHLGDLLRTGGLRPLMKDGQLSQDGLNDRLKLAYGADTEIYAFTDKSGRHWALIPQLCGSGHAHYSNFDPSTLSMRNREWLDKVAQEEWLRLFKAETTRSIAAKIDVGIIGLDFSDKGRRSPVDRLDELALKYPGVAWSVGEVTAHKEMVSIQEGDYAWTPESPRFQEFLKKIAVSGHMLLLHNDGGKHGIDPDTGRPAAAKTQYEYLGELIRGLGNAEKHPWRSDINVVIAHTFFGRYVRPNDTSMKREVKVGGIRKTIRVPEHIFRMYQVAEKIPNARFDISWNDISQAYAHPNLRKHLINFILDYPDRVLFGSDTVKPVNAGHYNQGLYTILPVLADLARRPGGRDALWMVLRGNYETLRDNAQTRVTDYTRDLLEKQVGRGQDIIDMDGRLRALRDARTAMRNDASEQLDAWVAQVTSLRPLDNVEGGPGVFEALYDVLGRSEDVHPRGQLGPGTPGGHPHADHSPERRKAWKLTGWALGITGAAVAGLANTPISAETANSWAFLSRGLLTASKAGSSRWLRLQFEDIFEQGRVTREKLDRFVQRIQAAQGDLGFSEQEMAKVLAATEQFWANYQHLDERNTPLQRGETREHRFFKIMAKTGEYQVTVDRILGGQASSITRMDPRRTEGLAFRVAQLATYAINDAAFVHWLSQNGLDTSSTEATLYSTFRVLFAAGNAVLTGHTAVSLAAGRAGVNWDSTKPMQWTNFLSQASVFGGSLAWMALDASQAATAAATGQPDAAAVALLKTYLDVGFTYCAGKSMEHTGRATIGFQQEGPSAQEQAALWLGTYLFLRMVVGLASGNSEPSAEERRDGNGSQGARPK
jgi:Domain of unknown function (DUF4781)